MDLLRSSLAIARKDLLIERRSREVLNAAFSFALVVLLLFSFVVYYFANWKALADVWHVR